MANRRRRVVRRHESKPVEEDDPEEEFDDDEVVEEDDDEEEEEPAPKAVRKGRQVEIVEPDDDEPDDDEEEEPAPAKVRRPARAAKAAKTVEEDDVEEAKPVVVKSVNQIQADNIVLQVMEQLESGKSILITSKGNGKYTLAMADAPALAGLGKLRGKDYENEVQSPEYQQWYSDWKDMTTAEKQQFAKKNKVTWDKHEDPRVDIMRMTEAVRLHLGVDKYKPEYQDRAARNKIRG